MVTCGYSPLHLVALYGDKQLMEKIMKSGRWSKRQTISPLHIAAFNGHLPCVRILLSQNSFRKCGVNEITNLTEPSCYQEPQILIYKNHTVQVVEEIHGTPLHYASWQSHVDVITELLKFGANLNTQDKRGKTPLYFAAEWGHHEACEVLISAGANLNSRDFENICPLHATIFLQRQQIVESLIRHGPIVMFFSTTDLIYWLLLADMEMRR